MKNKKMMYQCHSCGHETLQWQGKCSSCHEWNTLVECELITKENKSGYQSKALPINEVLENDYHRIETSFKEYDRVMGGGFVKGSLTLISGHPGVGKSTLMLNLISHIIEKNNELRVLYVSGEETIEQVSMRANRMGINSKNILILHETIWENIKEELNKIKPNLLILDSVQTTRSHESTTMSGGVSQIKEITFEVMNYSKEKQLTSIIIGHINKDGAIAGPKVLEHMVDTVLHFEGDQESNKRVLRSSKNRFGSIQEIGLFEMTEKGLKQYDGLNFIKFNPAIGKSLTCVFKGSRTYISEVQVLVRENTQGNQRLICRGVDTNRVNLLLAIIEKHLNIRTSHYDLYLSSNSNEKLLGRESDFGIIAAIVSSIKNKLLPNNLVYFGEVGLDSTVSYQNKKLIEKELTQLGFDKLAYHKCLNQYEELV